MHDDPTLAVSEAKSARVEPPMVQNFWGGFRLEALVGRGGFGEVYRAWDPNLEREVALKLLLPNTGGAAQSEDEYKAMLREARALASVRHTNIVPVYGIARHEGRVGFWTDFVKGKTLSVLLASQGPFGYREAALIGLDVTRALSAVHRTGILHRDIKAENVMREEGGRILLMDFGLSTLAHGQTNTAGTPNYMAPELWKCEPATVATDIYALGVLLYFLVAGEHPVRLGGLSAKEAVEALTKRRALMDVRSDLPESFLRTVSTAMDADPAKRFATAGELAEALAECLGTAAPKEPGTLAAPAKRRWNWKLVDGVAVAVVLLIIGAFETPTVKRWLHPGQTTSGSADASPGIYDQYLKAQGLLQKSYKDANVAEAVKEFQDILKQDPNFGLANAGLGTAYFVQYRNTNDEKLLDNAKAATTLAVRANLAPGYVTQARIEAMAGDTQLALQDAQKAADMEPRSAEAWAALAEVYEAQGRTSDAITVVQKAMDLAPENSMWPVRLGNYLLLNGDLNGAAEAWESAIKIDDQNVIAWFDLGIVNLRQDKLADARSDFQKVLQTGPDSDSYRGLGTVFVYEGKYADAAEMDKKAIALDPSNYQDWANLGSVYLWSGSKREEAVQAYGKAIALAEEHRKKTPDNPELLVEIADYYASIGNPEKSLPLVRRALALSQNDPNIDYLAGETYELSGQRGKAIPLIAKALASGVRNKEFERSPELAALRSDPAFSGAMVKAKADLAVDSAKKLK